MPTLSLTCPHTSPDPRDTARWVAYAAALDVPVWFGQHTDVCLSAGVGFAAGAGHRATVGQGVTLIPTTNAFAATLETTALHRLTGSATRAYYSPGYPAVQQKLAGRPDPHPLRTARTFLQRMDDGLRWNGVRDQVELGLGVLRPGMARLAGEVADGALTWLVGARYLREVLQPAVREGAASAGRAGPRMVATVHTSLTDPDLPRAASRALRLHLGSDHYRDLLTRQGVPADPSGDGSGHVRGLLDLGLFAGPDELAARVADLGAAGADEVAVVAHDVRSLTDLEDLWAELAHRPVTRGRRLLERTVS